MTEVASPTGAGTLMVDDEAHIEDDVLAAPAADDEFMDLAGML